MEKLWCIIWKKRRWLRQNKYGFVEIYAHKEMSARKKAGEYIPKHGWIDRVYIEYKKRMR